MGAACGRSLHFQSEGEACLRKERFPPRFSFGPSSGFVFYARNPRKNAAAVDRMCSWRHKSNGIVVRVIDYRLEGVADAEPIYRLVTTILDPEKAPAPELAALYHDRWEIETALDELKTHLRGSNIILRSKTPDLVRQEFYGFLMAHFAIRGLMHEAALKANEDPDRLSFLHAVRVVRRKLPTYNAIPPSGQESLS